MLKHPHENLVVQGDPFKERLKNYLATGIKDLIGLSFPEWIELPRHLQNMLIETCAEFKSTQVAQQQKEINELDKLTGKK